MRLLHTVDGFDGGQDPGSLYNVSRVTRAADVVRGGVTGRGVDIALIDSGTVPVNGLSSPGKVIHGADLSFESQADNLEHLDTFGHGTHLAGIIAGRDDGLTQYGSHDEFSGIAPEGRIVSVKVANAEGATDLSQVLAAIDWVVEHRIDRGLNIRVLNLSFGTDGVQDYREDPLAYAAEVAWRKGIVVVAAAGNSQFGDSKLNNPAYDPYLIAVGAADTAGTLNTKDDTVPSWSASGDGVRGPDLVAPGRSVVSLRAPNSNLDQAFPRGRVNPRFFRGSGTSQAAAVVSGAAALLLEHRPQLTPDQVKRLLVSTASPLPLASRAAQGAGLLNVKDAVAAPTPAYMQTWPVSNGKGSLAGARGSARVADPHNGLTLSGEANIFGHAWDGGSWSLASLSGDSWQGGNWNGFRWSGDRWAGDWWLTTAWTGTTWGGTPWGSIAYSSNTWSSNTWSSNTWSSNTWSSNTWSSNTWSSNTWSSNTWSSQGWGE